MTPELPELTVGRVVTVLAAVLMMTSVVAPATAVTSPAASDGAPSSALPAANTDAENATTEASSKVSSNVQQLIEAAREGSPDSDLVTQSGEETLIEVRVEAAPGQSANATDAVETQGGTVTVSHEELSVVSIPADAVGSLADSSAIERIVLPERLSPTHQGSIVSQGIENINASDAHAQGYNGSGVTVAVIDLAFNARNSEISDHVAEFKAFGSEWQNVSGAHGTAVAEIVVDTAPNVTLLLYSAGTTTALKAATDHIDQNTDADIASMSLGVSIGPFDGTSELDEEINGSVDNGTAWFVSAGNAGGGKHLGMTAGDTDGDGWVEFEGDRENISVTFPVQSNFKIDINWNDFPGSSEDYNAFLYNSTTGSLVAESKNVQDGSTRPVEQITASGPGNFTLRVTNLSASGTAEFDIFASDRVTLVPNTSARSITRPATEESVVTVGAVYYGNTRLESFSSRGPTIDGRLKPELVAPDGVNSSIYGTSGFGGPGFFGTSAAQPHAAGVAALLLDAEGTLSARDLEDALTRSAVPLRGTEPNNQTGYGLLNATGAIEAAQEASGDDGNISIEQIPGITTGDGTGLNTTKQVAIRADQEIALDNGTNYRFNLTNDDSGETVTLALNGSVTVPAGDPLGLMVYEGDGSVKTKPTLWPSRQSDPISATVEKGSIPVASNVTNFSVALINASDGTEIARTASEPSVVGYEGVLSQNSTTGTVELSLPRDVLPTDATVDLYISEGDVESGDRYRFPMSYDSGNDSFVATVDASNFSAGEYGWETEIFWRGFQILQVRGPGSANEQIRLGETETVRGQFRENDDTPAANDTLALFAEGPLRVAGSFHLAGTNATGNVSLSVESNATFDVQYYQWKENSTDAEDLFPRDDSPDLYAVSRINTSDGPVDLGRVQFPTAYTLNVTVENGIGTPVENASIGIRHHNPDDPSDAGWVTATDADGMLRMINESAGPPPGVEVVGNVTVEVDPPANDSRFADKTYTRELNVTSDTNITVTLTERHNITGTVENATGDPINGSFVVANGSTFVADETSSSGAFELAVQGNEDYSLGFVQEDAEGIFAPRDGTVDLYEFRTVNTSADLDVGTVTIPDGHVLNVSVEDASGDPVENASVVVRHHNDTSDLHPVGFNIPTNPDGLMQLDPTPPGIEVLGNVSVTVTPPENDSRFGNGTYERNVTVTADDRITVTLSGTCVADAVSGSDDKISLSEIQKAIDWWARGAEVPGTGGETISLSGIQDLIDDWAKGTPVSCS